MSHLYIKLLWTYPSYPSVNHDLTNLQNHYNYLHRRVHYSPDYPDHDWVLIWMTIHFSFSHIWHMQLSWLKDMLYICETPFEWLHLLRLCHNLFGFCLNVGRQMPLNSLVKDSSIQLKINQTKSLVYRRHLLTNNSYQDIF